MVNVEGVDPTGIDYADFDDTYTGIVAMIFVQAAADLAFLRRRESCYKDGCQIRKLEIINFFRSEWADYLADAVHLDMRNAVNYSNRVAGLI